MRRRKHPTPLLTQVTYGKDVPVEIVRIEGATRLFTHHEGDALASSFIKDAIVKVIPSAESTGPTRTELREFLLSFGAAHVWFAPRAAGRQVVAPDETPIEKAEEPPRVVILRMVDDAHTKDRALLAEVVEQAITAEGM